MEFWGEVFGTGDGDISRDAFLGSESEYNKHTVYTKRSAGLLAGTCALSISKKLPILGGVSGVATAPDLRRSGIGTEVCRQATEDFQINGGQGVFLGTGNPEAARIYHRLGWRKLAGSAVMANITGGETPEAFLVDYFREKSETNIISATPEIRLAMIPLLHSPHDWQILDANTSMYSTRYSIQTSCMGLYRKYVAVRQGNQGEIFCAQTKNGRTVGLSTALVNNDGSCQIDGFTHLYYLNAWNGLIKAAEGWGVSRNATSIWAKVSVEDEEKKSFYETLGFRDTGHYGEFEISGRKVAGIRLEL